MEETIKKFIIYLEEIKDTINKEIIELYRVKYLSVIAENTKISESLENLLEISDLYDSLKDKILPLYDKIVVLENFIRILETPETEWKTKGEVFNDFDELNEYLLFAPLSNADKMNLVFIFIKKNIAIGLLNESTVVIDYRLAEKPGFNRFTEEEIKEMIFTRTFNDLDDVSKNYIIENLKVDTYNIIKQHKILKEHYFDKEHTYQEEDIASICNALEHLKIEPSLCEMFSYLLKKELKKRNRNVSVPILFEKQSCDSKVSLDNKEYHRIYKEIRTYFDIENKKLVRPLTWNEAFYIASLLIQIGESDETVSSLFKAVELWNKKQFSNPISTYNVIYPRLKYYKDECELSSSLQNLEAYLQEMFLVSDEDYVEWKVLFESELKDTLLNVPKDFRYEHDRARQLVKKK